MRPQGHRRSEKREDRAGDLAISISKGWGGRRGNHRQVSQPVEGEGGQSPSGWGPWQWNPQLAWEGGGQDIFEQVERAAP